jgi:hypothetical protein
MEVRSWQATNDIFIIDVKPGFWNLNDTYDIIHLCQNRARPDLFIFDSEERYLKYQTKITWNHKETIDNILEIFILCRGNGGHPI